MKIEYALRKLILPVIRPNPNDFFFFFFFKVQNLDLL